MIVFRSVCFMLAVVLWTVVFGLGLLAARCFPLRWRWRLAWYFRRGVMALSAHVLGITCEVRGLENLPKEPAIILSKHQSAWETVALQDLLPEHVYAVFVLKRELLSLPFIGWGLSSLGMISIDRASGRAALEQVREQGADRLRRGFWVIVFPEGTRVAPGCTRRYKQGGAHLALHTGAKVVPVALNAGEYWPRNAFLKRPGRIIISIGPVIEPQGLSEQEINARAEAWIEGEMRVLSPHRYPDSCAFV